jgi:hypothetical protein
MNTLIREAAGRAPELEREQPVVERQPGKFVGGGRVSPQWPPRRRRADNRAMNDVLRAGAFLARSFTVPGGVDLGSVDLDPFRRR